MRLPYEDSIKYIVVSALLLGLGLILNQGQSLPRSEPELPFALLFLSAGLASGLLGLVKLVSGYTSRS